MPKFLFLAGSARQGSLNKKLVQIAAKTMEKQGHRISVIDLKNFKMPLYDGDCEDEHGLPENAILLKKIFREHDGIFIASPEYNSSFSPLLKNTLDWISRPHEPEEPPLCAFKGKVVALGAVSPGGLGGLRGLVPLRMMLGNIGVTVIPTQVAIGNGFKVFNEEGMLKEEGQQKMLMATLDEFVRITKALC